MSTTVDETPHRGNLNVTMMFKLRSDTISNLRTKTIHGELFKKVAWHIFLQSVEIFSELWKMSGAILQHCHP